MRPPDRSRPAYVLALHASAVVTPGGVLLFLGPAGVGKSTICQLLAERFPPLADDAVYLTRRGQEDGTWNVVDGSPWAFGGPLEEGELAGLEGVPLRAILRLFQDPTPRLAPITPRETCRHLTDALFEVGWQQRGDLASKQSWFAGVAEVARNYPSLRLYFALDQETRELVLGLVRQHKGEKDNGSQ